MKTCPASEFGCTCNRCAVDPDDDLQALKQFNRATYTTALFLIFLAAVLGVLAVGLWRTEQVHKAIVAERNV
jgi:predicted negative regulator of RcsB-dependent stress response